MENRTFFIKGFTSGFTKVTQENKDEYIKQLQQEIKEMKEKEVD